MKFTGNRCISQSIKIGIDLPIDECDLIDIDCTNQSVEIDDTLVFSSTYIGGYISHQEMKTSMQTVNFLTIELQFESRLRIKQLSFF